MPAPSIQEEIVTDIRRRITDGTLEPGARLPTKPQLAAQWGCSTQPLNMALARLEAEGFIIRRQGKGIFVAEHPPVPTRRRPARGR